MADMLPDSTKSRAARPVRAIVRPADFTLKENILGLAVLAICAAIVIGAIVRWGTPVLIVLIAVCLVAYSRAVFLGWVRLHDGCSGADEDTRP